MELLGSFTHYITSFIVVISVIVFIHEFGHYIIAKLSGVRVEVFSIGFGPEIWGRNDRSGTRWRIAVFPLGGYVRMFGDEGAASTPDQEVLKKLTPEEEKMAFHTKSLPVKAAIVAGGPVANFLLSIVILTFFFQHYGKPFALPVAQDIVEGMPAEQAGIRPGDRFVSINSETINGFSDLQRIVSIHPGMELNIEIEHEGTTENITLTPAVKERPNMFGEPMEIGMIGIASPKMEYRTLSLLDASAEGVRETYIMAATTLKVLGQMLMLERGVKDLGGPIRIAKYSGESTSRGIAAVLMFMAILSVNLGLINLFPIPTLDGGHLMYYAVEAVRGKPMAEQFQEMGFRIGMGLILLLFVFSTFNDVRQLTTTKQPQTVQEENQ